MIYYSVVHRYGNKNSVQVKTTGSQDASGGNAMKGGYTFVYGGIRYLVKFTADQNGYQPVFTHAALSNEGTASDELIDLAPPVLG